tara:strand:- start:433 stop:855 length:423 start_codon:yes stop_codon:yes gene_type:complete
MNTIYTILLVSLLVSGLSFLAYRVYLQSQKKTSDYLENNEFVDKKLLSGNNLLFFYTDWCKHCRKSKPIWENLKKNNDLKVFNLNLVDIDGEDEKNYELLKNYKIKEYPTIILEYNNKKFIFDANLTTETLMKFLQSVYK